MRLGVEWIQSSRFAHFRNSLFKMPKVLKKLTEYMEEAAKFQGQLVGALIYPAVLLFICSGAVLAFALVLVLGPVYGLLYYGIFRWVILRFDLRTPGREAEPAGAPKGGGSASRGMVGQLAVEGWVSFAWNGGSGWCGKCTRLEKLVRLNRTRSDFAEKFEALI